MLEPIKRHKWSNLRRTGKLHILVYQLLSLWCCVLVSSVVSSIFFVNSEEHFYKHEEYCVIYLYLIERNIFKNKRYEARRRFFLNPCLPVAIILQFHRGGGIVKRRFGNTVSMRNFIFGWNRYNK